ncbi:MAG: carboxypeptidase-like regulatory domain-containing protein, partial [Negativicutes bacterium]|nr:carboxypeptidase-like regulatory domain-containing protein [Negativicutes bacterium]
MRLYYLLRSNCFILFEQRSRRSLTLRSKTQLARFRYAIPQILLVLAGAVLLSSALSSWGQATSGSISGTVTDATGALVPRAAITATNTSTGVASHTTADSSGNYNFLSLPAGSYTVSATQSGFDTTTLTGISLRVYQQITMNISLQIGAATQTVTVQSAPPLVDTTNASLGTTVS